MPVLFVLVVIIVVFALSEKNTKKKIPKIVNILTLPSGELIKVKRNSFYKLRNLNKLKWNTSHKYWTITDKNRKSLPSFF